MNKYSGEKAIVDSIQKLGKAMVVTMLYLPDQTKTGTFCQPYDLLEIALKNNWIIVD